VNRVSDRDLLSYALQSLDPGRQARVHRELQAFPALQQRLEQIRAQLHQIDAPTPGHTPPGWAFPPARAWHDPRLGAQLAHGAVFGDLPTLAPGARFTVHLHVATDIDPAQMQVVVMRKATQWAVVWPRVPVEVLPLTRLPEDASGQRRLELSAGPDPGTQRWAVALVSTGIPVDWNTPADSTRWAAVREAMQAGEVPVLLVDVEVSAP